jgi:hypothetical protein
MASSPKQIAERKKLRPDPYYIEQREARERRMREHDPRRAAALAHLQHTYHRLALAAEPDTARRLYQLSDQAGVFQ